MFEKLWEAQKAFITNFQWENVYRNVSILNLDLIRVFVSIIRIYILKIKHDVL